ncbi:DUF3368 domain-containing protein [Aphanizomenon sp. CS-733/32]|uniref:DUF3368 domain-containing protein n=1 Tax=Aphanizomenon sp. CS-733/32 TaxID=3021715 RepID=UPI00232CAA61|nr:DUF3368 domain-containing protein [Aphanizomenon sp. CS-733/32]MDB9310583.1 DUF3368 domain-containing protein [Aphanizomenon sp. CS-733/32]
MIVVSDTSALSNLVLVDHLGLLESIYHQVIIPDVVASELVAASNPTISAILQPVMDALINQAGFRISPRLYQRILFLSQEL